MRLHRDSRARRTLLPAAVAVAVSVVLVIGARSTLGSPSASTPRAETPAAVHDHAQAVYDRFNGSREQRNAGFVLREHTYNSGMDDCMEEAGFPDWDWSLSRQYATAIDALGTSEWFGKPGVRHWSEREQALLPLRQAEKVMNADNGSPEREAAIDACLKRREPVSDAEADAVTEPAGADDLRQAWIELLDEAATRLAGDEGPYYECMENSAIPMLEGQPFDALPDVMETYVPSPDDIPTSSDDPASQDEPWQRLLRAEDQLIDADSTCRDDVYARHILALDEFVTDFEEEYSAQLDALDGEWSRMVSQAQELGYTGEVGPLKG